VPGDTVYVPTMTVEEVRERARGSILLVPVAATEQHGPYAPLHTDISNATEICLAAARQCAQGVLVASPVWFSPSPFDAESLPGSVQMRESVFKDALGDILESYLRSGWRRLVVVSGHGGDTEWMIRDVVRRLNAGRFCRYPDWRPAERWIVVCLEWWCLMSEFAGEELARIRPRPSANDNHGGDIETALQLHLHPELVDMSKARPGARSQPSRFAPNDLSTWHRQFVVTGYPARWEGGEVPAIGGDATTATPELGKTVFELAARTLADFLREFAATT